MYDLENEFTKLLLFQEPSKLLKTFTKKKYNDSFHQYCETHKVLLDQLSDLYKKENASNENMALIVIPVVQKSKEFVDGTGFISRNRYLLDLNCILAWFVIPALLERKEEKAKILAELLVDAWKKTFPAVELGIASFEEISEGFKNTKIFGLPIR